MLDVQVTKGGEQLTAEVPSGELKLVGPLEVIAGETTILTLDFNAERSIVEAGGQRVIFRPTVKLLVRKWSEDFVPEPVATPEPEPVATATSEPTATPTPEPTATPAPEEFVLHIITPEFDDSFSDTATIVVSGRTRVDAIITVNDAFVEPDADGVFSVEVTLDVGPNTIEVVASISTGEELSSVLSVIYAP